MRRSHCSLDIAAVDEATATVDGNSVATCDTDGGIVSCCNSDSVSVPTLCSAAPKMRNPSDTCLDTAVRWASAYWAVAICLSSDFRASGDMWMLKSQKPVTQSFDAEGRTLH